MPVTVDSLVPGEEYTRPFLADLWGYAGHSAISRGIVTPRNEATLVLFVTGEKQKSSVPYSDYFEGDILHIEGETSHANDLRLVNSATAGTMVYLFYRDRHHAPFVYFGPISLTAYELKTDTPSRFSFLTSRSEIIAEANIRTELLTHGTLDDVFVPSVEGGKRLRLHYDYERSRKNRARCVVVHGSTCCVCGFNFDEFYGSGLARGYIEVHHVGGLSEDEQIVDPSTDLRPLCSNCHSMAHRRGIREIVSIDEMRSLIRKST